MIVVSDTTPLHYLILTGSIGALAEMYGQVIVPPAVHAELMHPGAPEVVRGWMAARPSWLSVRQPKGPLVAAGLDRGESEAITLALEVRADVLLMDEQHSRLSAQRLGVQVRGTVGVLIAASLAGLVDGPAVAAVLKRTNFRASEALLDALRHAVTKRNANVRVLLTAAGIGSRLRPITDSLPKALVPIAGRPLLDYWFDAFGAAGIRHILVNTHHLPEQLRAYFATKNATGRFDVVETHEPTLLGSAGTINANAAFVPMPARSEPAGGPTRKVIGDEVLIIYSDNLSNIDLAKFLAYHRSHTDPFTMLLFRAQFPEKSGIAELTPGTAPAGGPFAGCACGKIASFVEKPRQPKSNLANAGLYAMSAALWHEIASWKAFDIGFDVLPRLVGRMHAIEHGPALARVVAGQSAEGYHRDIGTLESLAIAEADAARVFGRDAV